MNQLFSQSEAIERDVAAVARIGAVPAILQIICRHTGMAFSAVARVSETTWTACAVRDGVPLGLSAGDQLVLDTTLCTESRAARAIIAFDQARRR